MFKKTIKISLFISLIGILAGCSWLSTHPQEVHEAETELIEIVDALANSAST